MTVFDTRLTRQERTVFTGMLIMNLIQEKSKKKMEKQWFAKALGGTK